RFRDGCVPTGILEQADGRGVDIHLPRREEPHVSDLGEARGDVLARLEDLKGYTALVQMGCGRQTDRSCADHDHREVVYELVHGTDLSVSVGESPITGTR